MMGACSQPRCPARAVYRGKCPDHSRERERERGSAAARGYGYRWSKVRAHHLRHEPLCRTCLREGRTTAGQEVDHIIPKSDGGADECRCPDLAACPLQTLCASHHSQKTARENHLGFA